MQLIKLINKSFTDIYSVSDISCLYTMHVYTPCIFFL